MRWESEKAKNIVFACSLICWQHFFWCYAILMKTTISIYLLPIRQTAYAKMKIIFNLEIDVRLKCSLHYGKGETSIFAFEEHFNRMPISGNIVDSTYPSFLLRLLCVWAIDMRWLWKWKVILNLTKKKNDNKMNIKNETIKYCF